MKPAYVQTNTVHPSQQNDLHSMPQSHPPIVRPLGTLNSPTAYLPGSPNHSPRRSSRRSSPVMMLTIPHHVSDFQSSPRSPILDRREIKRTSLEDDDAQEQFQGLISSAMRSLTLASLPGVERAIRDFSDILARLEALIPLPDSTSVGSSGSTAASISNMSMCGERSPRATPPATPVGGSAPGSPATLVRAQSRNDDGKRRNEATKSDINSDGNISEGNIGKSVAISSLVTLKEGSESLTLQETFGGRGAGITLDPQLFSDSQQKASELADIRQETTINECIMKESIPEIGSRGLQFYPTDSFEYSSDVKRSQIDPQIDRQTTLNDLSMRTKPSFLHLAIPYDGISSETLPDETVVCATNGMRRGDALVEAYVYREMLAKGWETFGGLAKSFMKNSGNVANAISNLDDTLPSLAKALHNQNLYPTESGYGLELNQVSPILETPEGFHILQRVS